MASALDAALDVARRAPSSTPEPAAWSPERSAQRYQITGWGTPYFQVNARGQVEVTPNPDRAQAINLHDLTQELRARGLELPLLIRFSDIVGDRIRRLNESFGKAIEEYLSKYPTGAHAADAKAAMKSSEKAREDLKKKEDALQKKASREECIKDCRRAYERAVYFDVLVNRCVQTECQ